MKELGSHWTNSDENWYLSCFRKSVQKIQILLKSDKNYVYFTWRRWHIYDNISPNFFRMRHVSDKSCSEKQSSHLVFSNFFFENGTVCEKMWKNMVEPERPQIAIWWRVACWISKATRSKAHSRASPPTSTSTPAHAYSHAHTPTEISRVNIYYFSTATMALWTRLNITLFVHCLSCWSQSELVRTGQQLVALCFAFVSDSQVQLYVSRYCDRLTSSSN